MPTYTDTLHALLGIDQSQFYIQHNDEICVPFAALQISIWKCSLYPLYVPQYALLIFHVFFAMD